jgi:hypothetical protein
MADAMSQLQQAFAASRSQTSNVEIRCGSPAYLGVVEKESERCPMINNL